MSTTVTKFSEYSLRNREFILGVIQKYIFKNPDVTGKLVLAIAEGTGAHSAYFAEYFKNVTFIPSEYEKSNLSLLNDNLKDWDNIKCAIEIDASKPENWNLDTDFDMITCFNMIHISPWNCTIGLLKGAQKYLKANGWLITYGPYSIDGKLEPESNIQFNESLKSRNELWGIRDMIDIEKNANMYGLVLKHKVSMPANNYCLLFQKENN